MRFLLAVFFLLATVDIASAGPHPNARNHQKMVKRINRQVRTGNEDVLLRGAYQLKMRQGEVKLTQPMESRIVLDNSTLFVQQRRFGAKTWSLVSATKVSREGLTKVQRGELRAQLDRMFTKTHVGPKWKARSQAITRQKISGDRRALPLYLPALIGIETLNDYQERLMAFAMTYNRPVYGIFQQRKVLVSWPKIGQRDLAATRPIMVVNENRTTSLDKLLTAGIKHAMMGAVHFSRKEIDFFALNAPIELALYPGDYNLRDLADVSKVRSAFGDADGIQIVAPKGIDRAALAAQFNVKKKPVPAVRKNRRTRLAEWWKAKTTPKQVQPSYADKAAEFAVQVYAKHLDLHD